MRALPSLAAVLAALALAAAPGAAQETEEEPEVLGAPAAFGDVLAEERVEVAAGAALRELPDPRAPVLATLDAASELPLLERRGAWARVRYGALKGWVLTEGEAGAGGSPDLLTAGPAALPGREADPELLRRALSHLEWPAGREPGRLGPFPFYTDLADPALASFLDRVVTEVLAVYPERFGLDPGLGAAGAPGWPLESIVLFRREAEYRAFTGGDVAAVGLEEGGFAGFGLAGLYAGSRSREAVAALLVHEVTHLLNTRALGPRTPPWLEEGLANDLAYARIDPSGRLRLRELGGGDRQERHQVVDGRGRRGWQVTAIFDGALGALSLLARALDRRDLPSLATLTSLAWREMVDPTMRQTVYAESAFFIRYLLESEERAAGFRAYLRSVAAGGAGEGSDLLRHLGADDWDGVERGFRRWLRAEALAAGAG
ncbi:MAG TPA: hypothetical protein VF150_00685 [Thermoanaerobaculia bacterium]